MKKPLVKTNFRKFPLFTKFTKLIAYENFFIYSIQWMFCTIEGKILKRWVQPFSFTHATSAQHLRTEKQGEISAYGRWTNMWMQKSARTNVTRVHTDTQIDKLLQIKRSFRDSKVLKRFFFSNSISTTIVLISLRDKQTLVCTHTQR